MKRFKQSKQDELIQQLFQKITQLEQSINQLSKPIIEQVTIEKMIVQNPVLENIEFSLDKIDVKELSGALNIGNNIGVTVDKQKSTRGNNQSSFQAPQKSNPPVATSQYKTQMDEKISSAINKSQQADCGKSSYALEKTSFGFSLKRNVNADRERTE